ncbi:MAG: hypothetical protein KIH63_001350 [Candidatus Saccharibacteria bacterium]|nr:hypothetical protein [Candidatus Saccharibacteria bacterium]
MTDIISAETSFELSRAVGTYMRVVEAPLAMPGITRFAVAHGVKISDMDPTLVSACSTETVAVAIGHGSRQGTLVNIDLIPEGPAVIVQPNLYGPDGNVDPENGTFQRRLVRPLTQTEGIALIADIHQIIEVMPVDRLRSGL